MAASSSKSPGRTPPFVLVALVLLVVILGYNYWMMSSSNNTLRDLNDKLAIEAKDVTEKRLSVEKNYEKSKEELRILQGNLEQVKKSLQEKETELNTLRAEKAKMNDEIKNCKDSMAKCDEALQTEKANSEKLTDQVKSLEEELKTAKDVKPQECNVETCAAPIKEVLRIASKMTGTDQMSKALTDAKYDANKLMEGIEKMNPPEAKRVDEIVEPAALPQNDTTQA